MVKSKKIILGVLLFALFLAGCQGMYSKVSAPHGKVYINNDYVFCVEEAFGDQYNMRSIYSLKRIDGADIDPEIRFGSLLTNDFSRSAGASVAYHLSDDGKTIWIEEEQSSAQRYDSKTLHTVTLENLMLGKDSGLKMVEGTWSVSYRIQITEESIEILDCVRKIQITEDEQNYCQLSSIQLSPLGIHMEMELPDNDINKLAGKFQVALVLKNGTVIELPDLHHSIRGRGKYRGSCETMFVKKINLNEVSFLIVCGQGIPVNRV